MLGRRSAQRGLFEGDKLYLEFVGRKTFYGFLAAQRDELFQDEDFAGMYCPDNGRPSVPPSQLSVALLLQRYEDCSDLEAWARASYDLRWKVALGTETMERPFAKSTLQLFRAQLLVHPQMRLAFERSLELAKKTGYVRNSKPVRLAMDTSQILGRGAVKDTYNLISEGIRQVLRALARVKKQKPQDYARSQGLGRHFGSSIKGESEVDWEDEDSRSRFLTELVAEAHRALRLACEVRSELRAGSPAQQRIEASCQLLATILLQDLEVKRSPDGSSEKVAIKKEASGERICSVGDPEMRHGRKSASQRFDGHKLDIATEVESQLITAVDVLAGSAPDDEGALELVQESGRALEAEVGEVLTTAPTVPVRIASSSRRRGSNSGPRFQSRGATASTSRRAISRSTWRPTPAPARPARRPARSAPWAGARGRAGAKCSRRRTYSPKRCAPLARSSRAASSRVRSGTGVGRSTATPRRRCCKRRGSGSRARTSTAFGRSDRWSSTGSRA